MSRYKVLWIDDKWKEMDSFIDFCALPKHDIEVVPFDNAKDGMNCFESHLEEWSGVILDARSFLDREDQVDSLRGLRYGLQKLDELSHKRMVPRYIYTGQPDLLSNNAFKDMFGDFYEKEVDNDRLIADIKSNGDKLEETQLVHKYQEVFDCWPESRHDLLRILRVLEHQEWNNNSVLNDIRKMMTDIFVRLYKLGYCSVEPTMSNVSACSMAVCSPAIEAIVPVYIQRRIHSCVSITNPGSHRSDTDTAVANGRAPYLIQSLILEMLNILYWGTTLTKESEKDLVTAAIAQATAIYNKEKDNRKYISKL